MEEPKTGTVSLNARIIVWMDGASSSASQTHFRTDMQKQECGEKITLSFLKTIKRKVSISILLPISSLIRQTTRNCIESFLMHVENVV
jgi:hypothetical protein